jgi:hypothetical protein
MFIWILAAANAIFSFLSLVWKHLPRELKEKIIDSIVEAFRKNFREYYQNWHDSK